MRHRRDGAFAGFAAALLIAAAPLASAQSPPPLHIERIAGAAAGSVDRVDAVPGVGLTLLFRLHNPAPIAQTAQLRAQTPEGWQVLFMSDRIVLAAAASSVETLTVVPPRSARAGDYRVALIATAGGESPIVASVAVRVPVRRQITASWDDAPPYVSAGASLTPTLVVANEGNGDEAVVVDVRSASGSAVGLPWTHAILPAGDRRRIRVSVRTSAQSGRAARETLTATVTTPAAAVEAGYQFDIVAEGRNAPPERTAFPASVAVRFGQDREIGFGSFVGTGALDRAHQTTMDLRFLARDRTSPLLLERDEYAFSLSGPRGRVMLGDQVWSMSLLTESGHYGFGGGARVDAGRWFAKAFLDTGRRDTIEASQTGGAIGVRVGHARASLQYLERFRTRPGTPTIGEIGSARLELLPVRGLAGDIEIAQGRRGSSTGAAIAGQASHTSRVLTIYGRRVRADNAFPIRDRTALLDGFGATLRPAGQLQLEGSFDGTEQLPTELLPVDAPTRQRTTRAAAGWGTLVQVQASRLAWTAPGTDWMSGWRRESVAARSTIPIGLLRLTPGIERGRQASPGIPEAPFSRHSLRASLRWKHNSVSARGEVGRGTLGGPDRIVRRVSLAGTLRPIASTAFRFQVNENSIDTPWLEGARWTDVNLEHTLPWRHQIVALYRRYSGGGSFLPRSEAYRADYVIPLGIPLKRSTDDGRVTLHLHDGDTGRARPDVLVQLAKTSLLTDRGGAAEFNRVTPGEYFLTIAASQLGADRTVVPAFPVRVVVTAGGSVRVDATIVRSASLSGVLQVFQFASGGLATAANAAASLVPVRAVAGVMIELSGPSGARQTVTDTGGRYAFEALPPGEYRVRVVRAAVPPFYQIDRPDQSVTLGPGGAADIAFRIVPKSQGG
jgi:hypothetical protein